ncbi:hypothetical protein D0436_00480 [Shewanella decolorationis]|uniref:Uncharacterized protein n=1 Tax=Shewanella decolorationis TaxID=256839 RepID=A0A5B8QQX8_9GAMM|nr:hypothetical protein [Shewanella decolorationis]QDZ89050.1 hypothetical protein D0436_00480 [Shewanella decolorationis]
MNSVKYLSPQSDESVQGFIFRVMLLNGWGDFTTLITHGGWGSEPSAPFESKQFFNVFDACLLLNVFEKQLDKYTEYSLFSDRFSHINLFRETFFPHKRKASCGSSIPLRFCRFCIEEQLYDKGFSYFKLEWLTDTFCKTHLTPMYEFKKSSSLAKIKNSLMSVLLADWEAVEELLSTPSFCGEPRQRSSLSLSRDERVVSFSPCAQRILVEYFMSHSDYYPTGCFSVADYGFLSAIQRKYFSKNQRRAQLTKNLEEVYEYEISSNYQRLMDFNAKNLELKQIRHFGKLHWLIKSKVRSCEFCFKHSSDEFRLCLAAGLIYYSGKGFSSKENLCDKSFERLELDIELHQRRLKISDGERVVCKSIEKSNHIAAVGGLEIYQRERELRLKAAAKALDSLIF